MSNFKLIITLLMPFVLVTYVQGQDLEYFTIDQYKKKYPEQVQLMKDFSEIVRSDVVAVKSKKKINVTFVYPGRQISDYWRRSISSFRKRMDEIGIQYEIKETFTKVNELRKQTQELREIINTRPDYLVFTLDAKKHEKLIGRVLLEGKTKLILQNITTPKKVWDGNQPFLYVGFDHLEGSKLLAEYYIKQTGGTGTFSLLYHTKGYVSEMRGKQFIKYIEKKSNLKVNRTFITNNDFKVAEKATVKILKDSNEDSFIYACSTDIAMGIISGINKSKVKVKPQVNGWGGGTTELEQIIKGNLDVTVMRMNDDNGVAMAEAIRLDLDGQGAKVPTIYSGDFYLVKKGIDKSLLEKLKKRAFRYSGE